MKRSISIPSLIAVNTIPLFGVLFFSWDVFTIIYLYWLENVVMGLYTWIKIFTAGGFPKNISTVFSRLFVLCFFTLHFGIFTGVHGAFVVNFFGGDEVANITNLLQFTFTLWIPILGFVISHGISLITNYFGKGEYKTMSHEHAMMAPYGRVVIMHVVILFGGFIISIIGAPVVGLILLIVLKVITDVSAHIKEHTPNQETYYAHE